jgi:hypothetical protein
VAGAAARASPLPAAMSTVARRDEERRDNIEHPL